MAISSITIGPMFDWNATIKLCLFGGWNHPSLVESLIDCKHCRSIATSQPHFHFTEDDLNRPWNEVGNCHVGRCAGFGWWVSKIGLSGLGGGVFYFPTKPIFETSEARYVLYTIAWIVCLQHDMRFAVSIVVVVALRKIPGEVLKLRT